MEQEPYRYKGGRKVTTVDDVISYAKRDQRKENTTVHDTLLLAYFNKSYKQRSRGRNYPQTLVRGAAFTTGQGITKYDLPASFFRLVPDSVLYDVTMPLAGVTVASASIAAASLITIATAHGFTSGDQVTIMGTKASTPTINDTYIVTVISGTTFTIPVTVTVAPTVSTGTVTRNAVPTDLLSNIPDISTSQAEVWRGQMEMGYPVVCSVIGGTGSGRALEFLPAFTEYGKVVCFDYFASQADFTSTSSVPPVSQILEVVAYDVIANFAAYLGRPEEAGDARAQARSLYIDANRT